MIANVCSWAIPMRDFACFLLIRSGSFIVCCLLVVNLSQPCLFLVNNMITKQFVTCGLEVIQIDG